MESRIAVSSVHEVKDGGLEIAQMNSLTKMVAVCLVLLAMLVHADTEFVNGVTWTYWITNGKAAIMHDGTGPSSAIPRSTQGPLVIPNTLGGCPVTSIGYYAFFWCNGITSVIIPDGVVKIGNSAFRDCSGLTKVTIPSSVTTLEDMAFSGCSSLASLTLPLNLTSWSWSTFSGSGIETLVIPYGVTSIPPFTFAYCESLRSVTLPSSITDIDDTAFCGCCKLKSLTIPESVTSIGDQTYMGSKLFSGCTELESVYFEGLPPFCLDFFMLGDGFSAKIYYNYIHSEEWETVLSAAGYENAAPYDPDADHESAEGTTEIVFVALNGESSVPVATFATNSVYGRLPEAKRIGFTFAGWYTSLDGPNRVSAFSVVDPSVTTLYARWVEDDASLYAQWEANRYSIIFNSNGGEGVMAAQPFLYDQVQNLANGTFTRTGYTFKGWSTTADGVLVYKNAQSVSNLTTETGFAVALFAKWEKVIDVLPEEIEEWVGYTLAPKFKKPGETATAYRKRFETTFGDDYATAFFAETGKIGMDGTRLQVWQDYVAGTDPTDLDDKFTASITMVGEVPVISHTPELTAEQAALRTYKTFGKKQLKDEWTDLTDASGETLKEYNFFKVTVQMK